MYNPHTVFTAHAGVNWYGAIAGGTHPGFQIYCEERFNMTSGTNYGFFSGSSFTLIQYCYWSWANGNYTSPIWFWIAPLSGYPGNHKYDGQMGAEITIRSFWFTYSAS